MTKRDTGKIENGPQVDLSGTPQNPEPQLKTAHISTDSPHGDAQNILDQTTGEGREVPQDIRKKSRATPILISMNYPNPTWLSDIIKNVARWTDRSFVMEPSLNTSLQIFAPRPMTPDAAYHLFIASLSTVGLRAIDVEGVVKVVPVIYQLEA
jgi:hypothetical protein